MKHTTLIALALLTVLAAPPAFAQEESIRVESTVLVDEGVVQDLRSPEVRLYVVREWGDLWWIRLGTCEPPTSPTLVLHFEQGVGTLQAVLAAEESFLYESTDDQPSRDFADLTEAAEHGCEPLSREEFLAELPTELRDLLEGTSAAPAYNYEIVTVEEDGTVRLSRSPDPPTQ
ncbi:hypothetical protein L0Y40_02150 [Candidatus Wolfebacteria bacterium]|nr:hypothetical protein [Candidatus Wolfebacteria bacterium]